ncbi:hypothetical protein [Flammeovirga sp. EKP202]|uniref:hypothetical protein n=1 Tax=Flammeovirga sp. EKP202 TaxID=2770592 RepID=UPI00165F8917|nr:hypothetical protein [Flammeovirga sp. EKP202]MBD0401473.1 hypothetical protein [Flammeovirga sp. EKP202]
MRYIYLFIFSLIIFLSNSLFAQTDYVKGVLKTNHSTLKGYVRISKSIGHVVKSRFNSSSSNRQSIKDKGNYVSASGYQGNEVSTSVIRTYYFPVEGLEQNIYFTRDLSEPSQRLQSYRCKSFEDERGNYYEVVKIPLHTTTDNTTKDAPQKTIALMGLRIETGIINIYQLHYQKKEVYVLKREEREKVFTTKKKEIVPLLRRFMYDDPEMIELVEDVKKWDIIKVMNLVSSYNARNVKNIQQ